EEMRRLEATGTYIDDEINRLARGGKQRGTCPVLVGYCQHVPHPAQFESGGASGSGGCGDDEENVDEEEEEDGDSDS
ncbi:hypothetical protein Tco_0915040, partial [Tanacetum coccineum]